MNEVESSDGFRGLGLRRELLDELAALGYEEPTPVQRETIPALLAGSDLIAQAATGTGKTAAFALPIINALDRNAAAPVALVLVPTRELAMQVSEAFFKYGRLLDTKVVPIYGGQPIFRQLKALDRGVHVVVGTPGRVLDHIGRGSLRLDEISTVVLDEADEMLDMGFADDLESILESVEGPRQTALFSATMPSRIARIAAKYLNEPVRITVDGRGDHSDGSLVRQAAYVVQRSHKPVALARILDVESPTAALVFCRTRNEVDLLTETMNGRGYRAEALHGGMDQAQRDRVMGRLRDGTAELLIATDVAARGLDVDVLTHVVNYDVPSDPDSYTHRIGRVGRAGRRGVAITLVEPRERRLLGNIERQTKQQVPQERVPTVADLRAKQIESTVESVREAMDSEDLDQYSQVLDALDGDDLRTIALASIRLVHEASGATGEEQEIPTIEDRSDRRSNDRYGERQSSDRYGERQSSDRYGDRSRRDGDRRDGGAPKRARGAPAGAPRGDGSTGFVHLSLGRDGGIRPADLVGAIANESGLSGREIGPIRIADHYSVVGVPEASVDAVISAMGRTVVRGKRVNVRRFVENR